MPRFVVFDGAPTLDQCISARRAPPASSGRWLTLPLPLPPPLSTSPRQAAAAPPPVVESQYEDADTTIKSDRRSSSASAGGVEPAASQFADADTTGLFSSSKRPRKAALEHAGVEDPSEESSGKRVKRFEESYHEESEEEEQETHRDAASASLFPPLPLIPTVLTLVSQVTSSLHPLNLDRAALSTAKLSKANPSSTLLPFPLSVSLMPTVPSSPTPERPFSTAIAQATTLPTHRKDSLSAAHLVSTGNLPTSSSSISSASPWDGRCMSSLSSSTTLRRRRAAGCPRMSP